MVKVIFLVRPQINLGVKADKYYFSVGTQADGTRVMDHAELARKNNLDEPSESELFNEVYFPLDALSEYETTTAYVARSSVLNFFDTAVCQAFATALGVYFGMDITGNSSDTYVMVTPANTGNSAIADVFATTTTTTSTTSTSTTSSTTTTSTTTTTTTTTTT